MNEKNFRLLVWKKDGRTFSNGNFGTENTLKRLESASIREPGLGEVF
jgi:hypothetical protein